MNDHKAAIYQTFEEKTDASNVAVRLKALRSEMAKAGVDVFLVPRADEFQGESVPPGSARLAWLTGFTGSAGMAVITASKAALFVDGRYVLQAPAQTDTSLVDVHEIPATSHGAWISQNMGEGTVIGFDPWLMTKSEKDSLTRQLADMELRATENLIDLIWTEDRPARPDAPIEFLGLNRTGKDAIDKIGELRGKMSAAKLGGMAITLPESVCWLFNIRGTDVPNTPYVLSFALLPTNGLPTIYVVPEKITDEAKTKLEGVAELADIATLEDGLKKLAASGAPISVDPLKCPAYITAKLEELGVPLFEQRDPILIRKAIKNDTELAGMREAQIFDSVAMINFLHWFDTEAPKGKLTEIDVVEMLEFFRRQSDTLVDISFDTIAGAGPNAAMQHYRVTTRTNRRLTPGELMLVDSGGQYLSGTTDITRTMSTGPAGAEERDRFTRVLQGMIGLSTARFPKGSTGSQLDVFARRPLWRAGLNFSHGTGHGVGAYLGVHEGPVSISPRAGGMPAEAGMIFSNEPGYYKANGFGIRIENLLHVVESRTYEGFLEFETLTYVPIDTRLIEVELLSPDERDWLNAYHAHTYEQFASQVSPEVKAWLENATAPI